MPTAAELTPALAFLRLVLPETGWSNVVAIHPKTGAIVGLGVSRETLADIEPFISEHADCNLYWSVNELRGRMDKKATKADVGHMCWVHADVDDPTDAALNRIQNYRLPPTLILFSGGGYQAFWRLREPVVVNGNIEALESANKRVIADLDPEHPETYNLDRIMRVAGTTNWPTKTKLERGRVVAEARLIEHHPERQYSLVDFPAPMSGDEPRDPPTKVDRSADLFKAIREDVFNGATDARIYADYADDPHVLAQGGDLQRKRAIARPLKKARAALAKRNEAIGELNSKHALVWVGNELCVLWRGEWNSGMPRLAHAGAVKQYYRNRTVGKVNPFDAWLDSPNRAEFTKIVFEPGGTVTPGAFNLWRGFAVAPQAGDCSRFLAMVKDVICSGDEPLTHYVVAWCADAVQKPCDRPGIVLVLKGKQGTGKGTFAHAIGHLFGDHYAYASRASHVTGKFNAHLASAQLLFADEAVFAGDKADVGALKSMITEDYLPLEQKGRDVIRVRNHLRIIMASNQDWVVPAAIDDRRFAIIEVSSVREKDSAYFAAVKEQLNTGGDAALLHYLLNYDVSAIDLRVVPKTDARLEQQFRSMDSVTTWWVEMLMSHQHETVDRRRSSRGEPVILRWKFGEPVCPETLHQFYLYHCDDMKQNHRLSLTSFGMKVSRTLLPNIVKREVRTDEAREFFILPRSRIYELPSLKEARAVFEALVKQPIGWPPDNSGDEP